MTNSTTTTATTCSNCGRIAETSKPIPVIAQDGTSFEIAICDSDACQTNCIPVQPSDFFTLQSSGQRVRWGIGPCDECGGQFDTTTMMQGETLSSGYVSWICAYCAARSKYDDTTAKVLLNIVKGNQNMATITRDGITTVEPLISSVDTAITDDEQREFTVWSDGSLSIDGLVDDTLDLEEQVRLNAQGVRNLRDFLNSPRIVEMLATS